MIDFEFEKKDSLQEALMQLYSIITLLRSEDGCPWDREQDAKSVSFNLLDETYELLDAIAKNDPEEELEELGDVLLNALMLLEIQEEQSMQNALDSINEVSAKLIRRHPHVFSDTKATDSKQVIDVWNTIKVEVEGKKSEDSDFFSRIPSSLPPLEMANEIQKKIRKVGFDWPEVQGVIEKVKEELDEVVQAHRDRQNLEEDLEMELGDLLFAVVNLTRFLGYNPSFALHRSNQKMKKRFNALYAQAKVQNIEMKQENIQQMEELWQDIKRKEHLG